MEQIFFVYLLTFANGKVYVGMSKTDKAGTWTSRYRGHARAARCGKSLPIYNAWRKHGAPVQTILSTHATRDECALAEIDAIQQYDSMNPECGYNLQPGGQGMHAPAGSAVYELMRAKVWDDPERRRKSSEALKGKPPSEATIAGHKVWRESDEAKAFIRGVTQRPEVRAKMSEAMQRRLATGFREYLSEVQRGKPKVYTPEGAARRAAGQRAWLDSDEGKRKTREGARIMRENPENEAKRLAGLAEFLHSEANLERCREMAAKSRTPVRDLATGIVYESRSAAAKAHGVSGPTVGYWIRTGKFEKVN